MKYQISLYKNNHVYFPVNVRKVMGILEKEAKLSIGYDGTDIFVKVIRG